MNYLLAMTFSGSCICLMYMGIRKLAGGRISERYYYMLMKAAVIYFLLPLPYLKTWYVHIWEHFHTREGERIFVAQDDLLLYMQEGHFELNDAAKMQGIFFLVWCIGTLLVCAGFLIKYLLQRRRIQKCRDDVLPAGEQAFLKEICDRYPVQRKIQFVAYEGEQSPCNIGFFKPVIFYDPTVQPDEKKWMLAHEMVHIKRKDMFWRLATIVAVVMHWYNPCTWWLVKEFERVCEYSCDEQVLAGKGKEAQMSYALLLVKYKQEKQGIFLNAGLSKEGEAVQKRVEKIMKPSKKLSAAVSVVGLGAAVVLNSFTVLAYPELKSVSNMVYEDGAFVEGDVMFVPEGEESVWKLPEYTCYFDKQFVDEEGNVHEITKESADTSCIHEYVNGTLQEHSKKDHEACMVCFYHAVYCTKCSDIKCKEYIYEIGYAICTHP